MGHKGERKPPLTPEELRVRLDWDDARLLGECSVDIYRASGPGGQHRNKVSSAIRLHHEPTGYVVTGSERRSQHENRAQAVKRLREAIAIGVRRPPPATPIWPEGVQIREGKLKVNPKNPAYWHVIACVLDELEAGAGQLAGAAARLGVSTSSMTRFLMDNPKAWAEANRIRKAAGLGPLR